MRIGVVGIGKMGQPIASRLLAAGNEVSACNRSKNAALEVLAERGATVCASPGELAAGVDVILTALPTEDTVREVYAEMAAVAVAGQLYVDHSTVSINLNRWCAEQVGSRHASFLDAPVSGGPAGAEAGTLTVMVGGDEETFNRAVPVFEQFGSKIRLCGPVGSGQAIKLVNQLLVAVHTTASAEAAALAVQLGADLSTVQDVIGTSFGSSAMLLRNLPRFIAQDFSPATPIGLIAKDLSIIHREAVSAGVQLPLGTVAEQCFLDARGRGWAGEDMSALVKFWDRVDTPGPSGSGA
ncbi:MAG TPA: NAD(P)-dependent oxidoreductase [Candidatus Dormibacteraeota bacterium]